jgi:hypothetical protein
MRRFLLSIALAVTVSIFFQGLVLAGMTGGRQRADIINPVMPTGAILWDQLKSLDYKKTFKMWPGKTAFYQGQEPHGALLTTYINLPALMGVVGTKGEMPEGAIIVKENYSADKKLVAITAISKVKGYNPEAGDWFWAKYAPDGKIEAEGKVQMCINCHGSKKDNDYIMTAPLKKSE